MSIVESLNPELCKISKYVHTMYNRLRQKQQFLFLTEAEMLENHSKNLVRTALFYIAAA